MPLVPHAAIADALALQRARIRSACERAGRSPDDVALVAVSKRFDAAAVREALEAGQTLFGESYAPELVTKAGSSELRRAEWHFIGHLQSNKVAAVLPYARWVHSVDRLRLVDEIARRATSPVQVLVQVNVSGEASKHGCAPEDLFDLLDRIVASPWIEPRGLMTMPPACDDPEDARPIFRRLAELRTRAADRLDARGADPSAFRHLSMGMSHDLEVAVEEGATFVRVGTGIFGARD